MVTLAPRTAGEAPSELLPDAPRSAAEHLLSEARAGRGGLLVVDDCSAAALAGLAEGFSVLRARAVESEADLPYAALADLLLPILDLAAAIPDAQADALRAAFALASPGGDGRLAVCAGTLALLAAAAPVAVAVDDAQWLDMQSAEALNFAFRRIECLPVAAIVGRRAAPPPAEPSPCAPPQLLERAAAERAAGRPERALKLLDETLASTNDPLVRADAQHLRGLISLWRAAPAQASRELLAAAKLIESLDPGRAAWMTADAAWAAVVAGEIEDGVAAAERAGELGTRAGGAVEVLAAGLVGVSRLLRGRVQEARPLIERFAPLIDDVAFLERADSAAWPAALALVWLEDYGPARNAFAALVDVARTRGTSALLPPALVGRSELEFRLGDWGAARATASEAARVAEETGQPVVHAFALLALARVAAAQGREADCTAHVFEAVRLAPSGAGAVLALAGTHLGALELGLGRGEATISHLEQVAERAAEHGLEHPGVLQWAPDLIEAQLRCGRRQDARSTLERFAARAQADGGRWARAGAARCRGQLAAPDSFEEAFLEALAALGGHDPFDRARTELCYGERLRRARRRCDARIQLRAALTTFERLGARPWAERAAAELRATGETIRSSDEARSDELTPQELEIARLVGGGATNREAATALYLSPKTIEAHLSRIYRKLRVRSRTELARRLA
jgi:DNA-binding CsgD family transcriptional regulator/tetratricopeptide (TPR) repeat protein